MELQGRGPQPRSLEGALSLSQAEVEQGQEVNRINPMKL
jgi:hypothetical protein